MHSRLFTSLIGIVASSAFLPVGRIRAQDCCQIDSASVARADKVLDQVGNECDAGCTDYSAAWAKVRRAVEIVPLDHNRLAWILQFAHFLNSPDSAIALANLARQRWPSCAMSDSALVQAKALPPQVPSKGFVPDSATAVRVAVAVWIPIYGERVIMAERPFVAKLKDGVWIVEGSLPPGENIRGGTAIAKIAQRDGRILFVAHYQ